MTFYDEVMQGVEARIRDLSWSLLIAYLREDESSGAGLQEDGAGELPGCSRWRARWTAC